ncbi:amino acid permease [Russula vinacea]|nr:amino acid permease [Russula vinacea]
MSIRDHDPSSKVFTGSSDMEAEKGDFTVSDSDSSHHALQRQLKNRHIAMIRIWSGVIGTGLFLSSANSLRHGGPLGLLLGYLVVGSICYSVMVTLGEMISYLPIPGGHIKLAERFVNGAFSFTMGWNYWYCWTIVLPAELSAASVLIDFWDKNTNVNSAWVTICLAVVVAINFMGAGAYGEAEFIFASIKVLTITGLIILGVILDLGGGPDHDRIGFRYWKHPGPFVQYNGIAGAKGRFLGFWAVLTQAAFSFIGTEIVAVAAGEAKNPRRNLPKAIRRVYIRILLFYIGGVRLLACSGTAAASPFVIAINLINGCLLTSAWSAASSDLYTSSRALYGSRLPEMHLPFQEDPSKWITVTALIFSSSFSLLAYMGVHAGSGKVFNWFANMTAVAGLLTWFGFPSPQGIDRKTLPFSSRLQPYAAWYAAISCLLICLFSGWSVFLRGNWTTADFVTNYLPLVMFPILYAAAKYWRRTPTVRASEMDFYTGIAEIEADTYEEPPPRNKGEAFWQWLQSVSSSTLMGVN